MAALMFNTPYASATGDSPVVPAEETKLTTVSESTESKVKKYAPFALLALAIVGVIYWRKKKGGK